MEMDGHDNILVLKLSEGKDLPVERIGQLANGRWKINAIKIQTVKKVIVMGVHHATVQKRTIEKRTINI